MPPSPPPFFVVGASRSGTSWLGEVLNSHPRLCCTQELDLVGTFTQVARVLATQGKSQRQDQLGELPPHVLQLSAANIQNLAALHLRRSGKARFGDKTPSQAMHLQLLSQLFPGAQFIHIIRDGRDVAGSLLESACTSANWRVEEWVPRSPETCARFWAHHVLGARRAGQGLGPAVYMEVRYEDLMERPLKEGRRMMDFLGEQMEAPFEEALRSAERRSPPWYLRLSPREVQRFEECQGISALLRQCGYEPRGVQVQGALPPQVEAELLDLEQRGELAACAARVGALAAEGLDCPELWELLARIQAAMGQARSAAQLRVRAIRSGRPSPRLIRELLATPERPESVEAALHIARLGLKELHPELVDWLVARGMKRRPAVLLVQGLPPAPLARRSDLSQATSARVQELLSLRQDQAAMELALGLGAPDSLDAAESYVQACARLAVNDPLGAEQLVAALRIGRGEPAALSLLLGMEGHPAEAEGWAMALSRADIPSLSTRLQQLLGRHGLDPDSTRALVHALGTLHHQRLRPVQP